MRVLTVEGLNVAYGKVQVLWDVSFHVDQGESVCIIGPNGAGKTTTLLTVAGILKPLSGKITFDGEDVTGLPAWELAERGIALVPEGRRIFPNLTVLENLLAGAYMKRCRDTLGENLEMVFDLFPRLKERKNQVARTLSGGEAQMLAIARALITNPKLLMLDEPSMGLAPILVAKVFESIQKLRERGVTILLVEQHVPVALKVSDRAYVLENGKIVLSGTSEEVAKNEKIRAHYLGL